MLLGAAWWGGIVVGVVFGEVIRLAAALRGGSARGEQPLRQREELLEKQEKSNCCKGGIMSDWKSS